MKILLPLVCLWAMVTCVHAQRSAPTAGTYCYTEQLWQKAIEANPALQQLRQQPGSKPGLQNQPANPQNNTPAPGMQLRVTGGEPRYIIPVVIYVVHNGTAASNISMAQIQSQMDQLNNDMEPYGLKFCYARKAYPDTLVMVPAVGDSVGVIRINNAQLTNINSTTEDAQLKALSNLSPVNFLRIFVVNDIKPAGVLGYAYYPGTGGALDGVVVRADVFGSNNTCAGCQLYPDYNLGATLTHEVGHYLNLMHTFQGGCVGNSTYPTCQLTGDQVCDTPPTAGSFGCPSPAPLSCNGVDTQLVNNYMDYTNDGCKWAFTDGQNMRMLNAIVAHRNALVSPQNLINTGVDCATLGSAYAEIRTYNFNGCTNRSMEFHSLKNTGFTYTWNFGDATADTTGPVVQHAYTTEGVYTVTLRAENAALGVDAATTHEVFITPCAPANVCAYNKWFHDRHYMTFETGEPKAENFFNPTTMAWPVYHGIGRGDGQGNPAFYFGLDDYAWPADSMGYLLDTNFNAVAFIGNTTNTYNSGFSVFPVPNQPHTWCQVTIAAVETQFTPDSFYYNIIKAPGNGTAPYIPSGKMRRAIPAPITLSTGYGSRECIIPSCDGEKFWILVPLSHLNQIVVCSIDATEDITYHYTYQMAQNVFPYNLIAAPNGQMICFENGDFNSSLCVIHFNNITGQFGQLTSLQPGWQILSCFSPNSRFLYAVKAYESVTDGGKIYQYDLLNPDPVGNRRVAAQIPLQQFNSGLSWAQPVPGPDGKIYLGLYLNPHHINGSTRFGVINYPNRLANGQNEVGYNPYGPSIMPNYPTNYPFETFWYMADWYHAYGCDWQPGVPKMFNYFPVTCLTYNFYADECHNASWNFGDAASGNFNTSIINNPSHTFSAPGTYVVTVVQAGITFTDTIRIATPPAQISGTPVAECPLPHGNYSVAEVKPGIAYHWYVTNGTPAYTQGNNVNVQWNPGDTTAALRLVAIDTVMGCTDSTALQISLPVYSYLVHRDDTLCANQPYNFYNQTVYAPGQYQHILNTGASLNCDSVIVLNLLLRDTVKSFIRDTICNGSTYTFNGQQYTQAGTYSFQTQNAFGCDSTATLQLAMRPPVATNTLRDTICNGSAYTFNGQQYTQAGTYSFQTQNAFGCDSTATLQLAVRPPVATNTLRDTICNGSTYTFNGQQYTQAGTYSFQTQNMFGCDSTYVLALSTAALPVPVINQTADTLRTQSFVTYQWLLNGTAVTNGNTQQITITQNGNYTVVVTDANGCTDTSTVLNVSTVGVPDFAAAGIKLYPNPGSGNFTVQFKNNEVKQAEVTNALGEVVIARQNIKGTWQFELNAASGVYFLRVKQNGRYTTLRFTLVK